MGWLHAIPEGDGAKSKLDEYGADSLACKLPSSDPILVNAFHMLGFNMNVGMGVFPLTWCEVDSFSNRQSSPLSEWESDQLIMMSREYCSWLIKSKDRNSLAPWHHDEYTLGITIEHDRKRVVDAMMKQRAERQKLTG